jgi:hypothetical protein
MLAILAHTTFHDLYDDVANSWVDVANSRYPCSRADNFIAVSGPFCIGKKESLAKHLNLHWGNPATVFVWSQAATSRGALIGHVCLNATSVHKVQGCHVYFSAHPPFTVKTA